MNTTQVASKIAEFFVEEKLGYDNIWVENGQIEIYNDEAQELFNHYFDVILNIFVDIHEKHDTITNL
jgi:phosphosulfolactate synthase (CoM biosynthesis protein A)